jgi:dihydroorotate dehydrogenase (NAD+) catalytic subunit
MAFNVDLSVEVAGVKMKNPLVLSEGPLSGSKRLIERAAQHNIGAIVTKSIQQKANVSANPYMIAANRGLINADWTDIGLETWLEELKKIDIPMPLITNIGTNNVPPKQAAEWAGILQEHGAAMVTFSDYEPENLVDAVSYARKEVDVPIMVKLPPFVKNIADLCKRLEAAGVTMIAAMDAVGPAMDIDISKRKPILGNDGAFGYMSSAPIFPLTLAYIAEIAGSVSVPVLGVGGVTSAADVIKLIMAGATCVGMVGTPILKGLGIFDKIEADLRKWMAENNVKNLAEIRGCAQPYIHQTEKYGLKAKVDYDTCTACGLCFKSCYAAALTPNSDKKPVVNTQYCSGCGVCQSVCPVKAINVRE